MVRRDRAVVTLRAFVQLDLVVLDDGGLQLFGDALLDIARSLPNFEEIFVRLVVDRVGVDARPGLWLRRKDLLDGGLIRRHHYPRRPRREWRRYAPQPETR